MKRLAIFLLFLSASLAHASDAYFIRFALASRQITPCTTLIWHDEAILFNRTDVTQTISVLDRDSPPNSFTIAANSAQLLNDVANGTFQPFGLSVLHLDVPAGVTVSSRDEFYVRPDCSSLPVTTGSHGYAALPVFRTLTPAGKAQVHLGTDLGEFPARTNVAIYNASHDMAVAHIDIKRVCDNVTVDQRDVLVPPQTIVQYGGFAHGPDGCVTTATRRWMRYAVVTVDQPSLSFVSNVRETLPNDFSGLIPTQDLAVAIGTDY